jgi:hypothetical protein
MVTEHSKTNLPSQHQFRYVIFLICILVGPSLAILQLKGFHITFGFLTMMGILYVVKMDSIDLKKVKLFINFVTFVSIWAVNHRLTGVLSARYVLYLFYFTFTLSVFYFSFRLLTTVPKDTIYKIIQTFIYLDFFMVLLEVITNVAFFNYYPLAGSEYQIGSAFWSNVNTNATALILLNTSLYFLGFKKTFYFNSVLLMMLSLIVDAKLCFIAAAGQVILMQLLASGQARVVFSTSLVIIVPIIFFAFQKQLDYVLYTLNQTLNFLSNTEALEAIVSSGNMFSVAIRAFALSEMLNIIDQFSVLNWLFGIGFGNINIAFVNNGWGGLIEHFAPHLFYLEMLIYAGFSYYLFYFITMKIVGGRVPWRSMLIAMPTLGSIVAISSAVYFLPLYFFLAVLTFWEYEQLNNEKNDDK